MGRWWRRSASTARRRVIRAEAGVRGPDLRKACAWLANALIRQPSMLSTTANPTDGRFDSDAICVAEGDVHPRAVSRPTSRRMELAMAVNPLTIGTDARLSDAMALMKDHGFSGIPVVTGAAKGVPGKLVGILTNRDVRFATDPNQKISELMTHENLVTVREGVSQDEAKRMLHKYRIEKLLGVDDQYRCVGLITVKDMEKALTHPLASQDAQGR